MAIGITPLTHNITSLSFNGAVVDGEYPVWSDTSAYAVGDRVVRPDHHIYEALEGVGAKAPISQRRVGKYRICAGESGEHLAVFVDEQDLNRMKCRRVTVSAGGVSLSEEVPFPVGGSNGGRFVAYDSIKHVFAIVYGDSLDASLRVVSVKITNNLPVIGPVVNIETVYGVPTALVFNPVNGMFLASYSLAASFKLIPIAWDSEAARLIKGTGVTVAGAGDLMFDGASVWYTYTANTGINVAQVTVVDFAPVLGTPREISKKGALEASASYATGTNPYGVSHHPSMPFVYVTNYSASTISAYLRSTSNGNLTLIGTYATYTTNSSPYDCKVSPDGLHLYVSTNAYSSGRVEKFNINQTTGALSGGATYSVGSGVSTCGVFISPDGLNVYTCNGSDNSISKFVRTPSTGALSAFAQTTVGYSVYIGCLSSDGLTGYCANNGDNTLSILSRNTSGGAITQTGSIATGVGPYGVCITPDGLSVYAANFTSGTISIFARNPATGGLSGTTTIAAGTQPSNIIASPDSNVIYVVNRGDNNIMSYARDSATSGLTYLATYGTSTTPGGICIPPDGANLYVANSGANTVTKFACDYSKAGIKTLWDTHNNRMLLANAQGQYRGIVLTTSTLTVGALTAPTWWTPTIFSSTGYVYDLATYQFISLFADLADSSKGKGFTIAISGTSVSFGAVATYSTVAINPDGIPSFDLISGRFVFGYQTASDGLGYIYTGKISGTSVTFTGVPLPPEDLLTSVNGIVAWLDLGTTNAYNFVNGEIYRQTSTDYDRGTSTTVDWMQWTESVGVFNSLAILNLQAGSVQYTIKDSGGTTRLTATVDVSSSYSFVLSSLPVTVAATDTITIKITGRAAPVYTAKIGEYIIGNSIDLGDTQFGFSDRFIDNSEYNKDGFGVVTTVERQSGYTQSYTTLIENTNAATIDQWFNDRIAKLTVFVPSDVIGYEHLARYGRHFDKETVYDTTERSTLKFRIESVI
jgi:6-phosphogluconolactonase (cycloisomerase 2 family)